MKASDLVSLRRYHTEQAFIRHEVRNSLKPWETLEAAYRYYGGNPVIFAPPTFITEAETAWNSVTTPKTSGSITTFLGDVIAIVAADETASTLGTPTNTNTAFSYTLQQRVTGNVPAAVCETDIWTTIATAAQACTLSITSTSGDFGFNVLQFRNSDGVGASNKANVNDAAPSVSLTTLQPNSAIVGIVTDFEATATDATWPAGLGTWTKQTTSAVAAHYFVGAAWLASAGAVGAKTINPVLTTNAAPDYSICVCEIKGSRLKGSAQMFQAVHRASYY